MVACRSRPIGYRVCSFVSSQLHLISRQIVHRLTQSIVWSLTKRWARHRICPLTYSEAATKTTIIRRRSDFSQVLFRALDHVTLERLLRGTALGIHLLFYAAQQSDEELDLHFDGIGCDSQALTIYALVRVVEAHTVSTVIDAAIVAVKIALDVDSARVVQVPQSTGLLTKLLLHVNIEVDHVVS